MTDSNCFDKRYSAPQIFVKSLLVTIVNASPTTADVTKSLIAQTNLMNVTAVSLVQVIS